MRLTLLIVCSCLLLAPSMAEAKRLGVASQGVTTLTDSSARARVKVEIKTHEIDIGKPSDNYPKSKESSCTYSKYPCSLVENIKVFVGGNQVFVPRSAFADLADLNAAEVGLRTNGWVLALFGGDASEAYVARIYFNAKEVKRRVLVSALSPNIPLEETTYHTVTVGNQDDRED